MSDIGMMNCMETVVCDAGQGQRVCFGSGGDVFDYAHSGLLLRVKRTFLVVLASTTAVAPEADVVTAC